MDIPEIEDAGVKPPKRVWYRTSLFNASVIGAVGFLAPGLWNAMNSLGAGGAEKPYLINAANALVFGLMGFFCIFGAPLANRIGLKWTLLLGAAGYPVYSAGLYTNKRYGNVWFVLLGSVACGISAGLFWASEGAIAIGYPEPSKRATYLNIWVWWRTLGPIIGNSIVLGLNIHREGKGSVGYSTYIVFIVLQCLAVPVAFLLTHPSKVQRGDGSPVIVHVEDSWAKEFKALWRTCKDRTVILLLPIFWAVYFNQYSSNFKTYYFSVRARCLIAFLSDWVTILASQTISHWLDWKRVDPKKRLTYGWYYVILIHVAAWVYAWVVQEQYTASPNPPMFDYTTPGFVKGIFVIFLWGFAQQAAQNWLYYFVGTITNDIAELTRLTGILRGQESFGEAVSYGLNTKDWYGGRVPLAVNTILLGQFHSIGNTYRNHRTDILLGLCVAPTWIAVHSHVVQETKERDDSEIAKTDSDSDAGEVIVGPSKGSFIAGSSYEVEK
ncbi:hypothetical protein MAP00_006680 [Monascus purpureus]|nr:hypothetical protein MAP00_006680 [Monascus purpureus]